MARILADLRSILLPGFAVAKPLSNSLWDFSLAHYGKARVAEACLRLQDSYGVNINLLLWSLWLESQDKELDSNRLAVALAAIQPWDLGYVQPLRQLRRKIKQDFAADLARVASLREQIKRAELEAEKQEQLCLEKLALDWSPIGKDSPAPENVALYLHYLRLPSDIIAQALIACRG